MLSAHIGLCLKNNMSKLHKIFCMLSVAVARFSLTIRYVLHVLWMTLCFTSLDNTGYVVYGEAYGRRKSVSGRQGREEELQSWSSTLSALLFADWVCRKPRRPQRFWLWRRTMSWVPGWSLLSSIAFFLLNFYMFKDDVSCDIMNNDAIQKLP